MLIMIRVLGSAFHIGSKALGFSIIQYRGPPYEVICLELQGLDVLVLHRPQSSFRHCSHVFNFFPYFPQHLEWYLVNWH